jgi:hypothetical protein
VSFAIFFLGFSIITKYVAHVKEKNLQFGFTLVLSLVR